MSRLTFRDGYTFRVLTDADDAALKLFMARCGEAGIRNNSSRKEMLIDEQTAIFWGVFYGDEMVGTCGMHHFPLSLPAWGGMKTHTWRVGLRQATLPGHRAKFSSGLGSNLEHSFGFGGIFPLQIKAALDRGADKVVCTTNTNKNTTDHTGKLFQMDRVAAILARKGYATQVGFDVMIRGSYQNVWDLNPEAWGVV